MQMMMMMMQRKVKPNAKEGKYEYCTIKKNNNNNGGAPSSLQK